MRMKRRAALRAGLRFLPRSGCGIVGHPERSFSDSRHAAAVQASHRVVICCAAGRRAGETRELSCKADLLGGLDADSAVKIGSLVQDAVLNHGLYFANVAGLFCRITVHQNDVR